MAKAFTTKPLPDGQVWRAYSLADLCSMDFSDEEREIEASLKRCEQYRDWRRRFERETAADADIVLDNGIRATIDNVFASLQNIECGIEWILKRYGNWAVTGYGVECLERPYFFDASRVLEDDWLEHMANKNWPDIDDFACALFEAQSVFKAKRRSRKQIGKRLRFKVMRRDDYRCKLCGRSAEDGVILNVDHKHPVARGGTNDESNLWTLCRDCNYGKSALPLKEEAACA